MPRRLLLLLLVAAGLLAGTGCGEHLDHRTGPETMNVEMSRAFKRAYAGAFRMQTARADRDAIRHAGVRCRPRGPEPTTESRVWPWFCRVLWFRRDSRVGRVTTYGVEVDPYGCFEARTAGFPYRLRERILGGRPARNPLVYFRACP